MSQIIHFAFELEKLVLPVQLLQPLRIVSSEHKRSKKYQQILTSIREVGIVEPPIINRMDGDKERYIILDGHLRIACLQDLNISEVECLISKGDEHLTYNRKIARLMPIQEHKMIMKAIKNGVSEEKLAQALNLDIKSIRDKRSLLQGICDEVVNLLKDKSCPAATIELLKKIKPLRQIEIAQLLVSANDFSTKLARAFVTGSSPDQFVSEKKQPPTKTDEELQRLEQEFSKLQIHIKEIEESYGPDTLLLTVAGGYVKNLLKNQNICAYLDKYHPNVKQGFDNILDTDSVVTN